MESSRKKVIQNTKFPSLKVSAINRKVANSSCVFPSKESVSVSKNFKIYLIIFLEANESQLLIFGHITWH